MNCPHHDYVTKAQEKTNERLNVLEQNHAAFSVVVNTLGDKIDSLTGAIKSLIESNETKIDNLEEKFGNICIEAGKRDIRIAKNEDNLKEVRGWIIGAVSTLLIVTLGWIVWYCQNRLVFRKVAVLILGG